MVLQSINIAGAALVLAAFVLLQLRRVTRTSPLFNLLNMGGSFCLGLVAVFDLRYGWIALESAWFCFSVYAYITSGHDAPPARMEVLARDKCFQCGTGVVLPLTYVRTYTPPYCPDCVRAAYGQT